VKKYLDGAESDWTDVPRALVVPHAGLVYSGWVAAYAYALLRDRAFPTVVMVGPAHYPTSHNGFSLYAEGAFETPLGLVPIDADITRALLERGGDFADVPDSHRHEHCLEVQIPFLQETLTDFRIVPILMRDQRMPRCRQLAEALTRVWRDGMLLIASTDLSHHYPKEVAAQMDEKVEQRVDAFDPDGLSAALSSGEAEMCGGGPALAVLMAAKMLGCTTARVLQRADSSDSPDGRCDPSDVVGYLSAAIA
jgi:hypothetical protein